MLPTVTAKALPTTGRAPFDLKLTRNGKPVGFTKVKSCVEGAQAGVDRGCRGKYYMEKGEPRIHICCGAKMGQSFAVKSPKDAQEKIAAACDDLGDACAAPSERRKAPESWNDTVAPPPKFLGHKKPAGCNEVKRRGKPPLLCCPVKPGVWECAEKGGKFGRRSRRR